MPRSASDASTSPTGIVARGVSKAFDGEPALARTDFAAPPGAVSLIVGRNGAGKTTMLRMFATLVHPDTGEVRINGLDPVRQGRAVREQIGVALVNERSLFWRLSVLENLALFARVRRVGTRASREGVCREVLDELGLGALSERRAHALSAGQRQRAVLARAIVGSPQVLLIDEPLRGLDVDAEALVVSALQRRADTGATVVIATPSLHEYEALPHDRVTELVAARPQP